MLRYPACEVTCIFLRIQNGGVFQPKYLKNQAGYEKVETGFVILISKALSNVQRIFFVAITI